VAINQGRVIPFRKLARRLTSGLSAVVAVVRRGRRVSGIWKLACAGALASPNVLMAAKHDLLRLLYEAFNARNIERALSGMHPEVVWANGLEGGTVEGRSAVRDYWTRQWQQIDPRVEPQRFEGDNDEVVVEVRQVVRDREGHLIAERTVRHFFRFEDGLVKVFEIR
jgi:nuclear transport factor 2 (NTF2) superfamily protein